MFEPNEDGISWQDGVPEFTGTTIPIWSPKPSRPVLAILLGGEFCNVGTHHFNSRTTPHRKDHATCPGCKLGLPIRHKCYLPGFNPRYHRRGLLELTPYAVREYFGLGTGIVIPKRGLQITVRRRGTSAQSPVEFRLEHWKGNVDGLPPAFDMQEALKAIWDSPGKINRKLEGAGPDQIPH